MIRALVSSMYKHAGHHDLCAIFKQVCPSLPCYVKKLTGSNLVSKLFVHLVLMGKDSNIWFIFRCWSLDLQ